MSSFRGKGRCDDPTPHNQGRPGKGPNTANHDVWGAGGYEDQANQWQTYHGEKKWHYDGHRWQPPWHQDENTWDQNENKWHHKTERP